ncbi:MAG: hypothetical protein ACRDZV_01935 [Acidimicrobiia bacterium]
MTATLERPDIARESDLASTRSSGTTTTVASYLRWVLGAISLGAGGIHFAMIGPHYDEWWASGIFFAALAWFQVAWAVGMVVRPSRALLAGGALVNAGAVGVWAVSRTWGVPVGPHAGVAEAASFVDILATAFEGALLLGCLALILRPRLNRTRASRLGALPVGIAGLAVVVLTTMAFTPSFASGHSHGPPGHPAGGHGGDEAGAVAAGHAHDDDSAGNDGAHAAGHTNAVVQADGTSACEQAGVANEGNSGHGHRGPVPFTPLSPEERETFRAQVQASNDAVARYPTAADAEAAGWKRITPYVPCIAAHYLKAGAFATGFDPAEPEILLYDGTDPTSKIVGLSYLLFGEADTAPEGFVGENDPWHVHSQLCIGGGGVLGDESTTKEECEERGGTVRQLDNLWMTHMWNVPGWDSRWGLFSSEHPDLGGRIGDINGEPLAEDDLDASNAKE